MRVFLSSFDSKLAFILLSFVTCAAFVSFYAVQLLPCYLLCLFCLCVPFLFISNPKCADIHATSTVYPLEFWYDLVRVIFSPTYDLTHTFTFVRAWTVARQFVKAVSFCGSLTHDIYNTFRTPTIPAVKYVSCYTCKCVFTFIFLIWHCSMHIPFAKLLSAPVDSPV